MKKVVLFSMLLAVILFSSFVIAEQDKEYKQGELIVKYKQAPTEENMPGIKAREKLAILEGRQSDFYVVDVEGENMEEAAKKLMASDKNVEYAEPNYIIRLHSPAQVEVRMEMEPGQEANYILPQPNDPFFKDQYGMRQISALYAWQITTGSDEVIVGVIDTGIDYTHPDLAGNIWLNQGEIPGNSIDDDLNGYMDDIFGYDFFNNDSDPMDDMGHGTHCAGIIGAVGRNGLGVAGVSWNIKIMPLKFISADGYGYTSDALLAIDYAVANGVDILSNSWGSTVYSQALYDKVKWATENGVLFVAAAGNYGWDSDLYPGYPAAFDIPGVISVAASSDEDKLASFSNYGMNTVDLAAPGEDIISTFPNNDYMMMSGTSMACPHVAGAAALLLAQDLDLSVYELKYKLLAGTDKPVQYKNKVASNGRLNIYNSLKGIYPLPPDNNPPVVDAGKMQVLNDSNWNGYEYVRLNGTAIDKEGYIMSYAWYDENNKILSRYRNPTLRLSVGVHFLRLVATDNKGAQGEDTVTILIISPPNSKPVADGGKDITVNDQGRNGYEYILLNGSGYDEDGKITAYKWYINGRLKSTFKSFKSIFYTGESVVKLQVRDNRNTWSDNDTVLVTVNSYNICYDSDGYNEFVKGISFGYLYNNKFMNTTDTCLERGIPTMSSGPGNAIKEWWCVNRTALAVDYNKICVYGCYDGACLTSKNETE